MTRAEIIALGHVQHLIGRARGEMGDRNPNRQAEVDDTLSEAFAVLVGLLSRFNSVTPSTEENERAVSPLRIAGGYNKGPRL